MSQNATRDQRHACIWTRLSIAPIPGAVRLTATGACQPLLSMAGNVVGKQRYQL